MIVFAKLVSVIFNPLIIAPATFYFLIFFYNDNSNGKLLFYVCILTTTIIPAIVIAYFKNIGKISAYEAPIRKERLPLLAITSICNALGFVAIHYLDGSPIVKGLMFCYAVNTSITWAITKYWKISIHMIGLGGPFIAIYISGFYNYGLIIILILVYFSRLLLKAHNHAQLIAGITLAMVLAYFELTYLFL